MKGPMKCYLTGGAEELFAETMALALGLRSGLSQDRCGSDKQADPAIRKYFQPLIDYMKKFVQAEFYK